MTDWQEVPHEPVQVTYGICGLCACSVGYEIHRDPDDHEPAEAELEQWNDRASATEIRELAERRDRIDRGFAR